MSLKELERDKTRQGEPKKKTEQPKRWQVVMYYGAQYTVPCCACLLREVFKMSTMKAMEHISQAKRQGKISVFESTQDVVETKASEAQGARDDRAATCTSDMGLVHFRAEPK